MDDLAKQMRTSPMQHQAICIISSSYVNSNWSYSPETIKLGCDLCDLELWPLTLTFCMDITLVLGDNSWKFHDDTMMGTQSKRCDGQTHRQTDRTDRQTDGQTENTIHRTAWSQLKNLHLIYLLTSIWIYLLPNGPEFYLSISWVFFFYFWFTSHYCT